MKWCAINRCPTNNLSPKDKLHVSHFLFPRKPKYLQLWIQFCNRPKSYNPVRHRLCMHHFTPSQFARNLKSELLKLNSRPKLKLTAVPTIKACDVKLIKSDEIQKMEQQSDLDSDMLASSTNIEPIIPTMSLKKFSREYENRKMKREIILLKQKILSLERLNAAFREENKNLKRVVIEAEKTKQATKMNQSQIDGREDVEDVMVLPGYTVVLYK